MNPTAQRASSAAGSSMEVAAFRGRRTGVVLAHEVPMQDGFEDMDVFFSSARSPPQPPQQQSLQPLQPDPADVAAGNRTLIIEKHGYRAEAQAPTNEGEQGENNLGAQDEMRNRIQQQHPRFSLPNQQKQLQHDKGKEGEAIRVNPYLLKQLSSGQQVSFSPSNLSAVSTAPPTPNLNSSTFSHRTHLEPATKAGMEAKPGVEEEAETENTLEAGSSKGMDYSHVEISNECSQGSNHSMYADHESSSENDTACDLVPPPPSLDIEDHIGLCEGDCLPHIDLQNEINNSVSDDARKSDVACSAFKENYNLSLAVERTQDKPNDSLNNSCQGVEETINRVPGAAEGPLSKGAILSTEDALNSPGDLDDTLGKDRIEEPNGMELDYQNEEEKSASGGTHWDDSIGSPRFSNSKDYNSGVDGMVEIQSKCDNVCDSNETSATNHKANLEHNQDSALEATLETVEMLASSRQTIDPSKRAVGSKLNTVNNEMDDDQAGSLGEKLDTRSMRNEKELKDGTLEAPNTQEDVHDDVEREEAVEKKETEKEPGNNKSPYDASVTDCNLDVDEAATEKLLFSKKKDDSAVETIANNIAKPPYALEEADELLLESFDKVDDTSCSKGAAISCNTPASSNGSGADVDAETGKEDNLHGKVVDKAEEKVGNNLDDRVDNKSQEEMDGQADEKVNDKVEGQVDGKVGDKVGDEVENNEHMDENVDDKTEKQRGKEFSGNADQRQIDLKDHNADETCLKGKDATCEYSNEVDNYAEEDNAEEEGVSFNMMFSGSPHSAQGHEQNEEKSLSFTKTSEEGEERAHSTIEQDEQQTPKDLAKGQTTGVKETCEEDHLSLSCNTGDTMENALNETDEGQSHIRSTSERKARKYKKKDASLEEQTPVGSSKRDNLKNRRQGETDDHKTSAGTIKNRKKRSSHNETDEENTPIRSLNVEEQTHGESSKKGKMKNRRQGETDDNNTSTGSVKSRKERSSHNDTDEEKTPTRSIKTRKTKRKKRVTYQSPPGYQTGNREYETIPLSNFKEQSDETGVRRSRRVRCKPLAFWKNERLMYGPNDVGGKIGRAMGNMPVVKSVITAKQTPYRKRKVVTPSEDGKRSKAKKTKRLGQESDVTPFDTRKLTRKYDILSGEAACIWDDGLGSATEQKVIGYCKNLTEHPLPMNDTREKSDGEVVGKAAQAFNIPNDKHHDGYVGYIMGHLVLPPKGIKDAESVGACAQTFTVCQGQAKALEVSYADPTSDDGEWLSETAQRFLLSPGDMFRIPPGNSYRLQNHSKSYESVLSWTIIRSHA